MPVQTVDSIERSVHKTNEWLSDLATELGVDHRDAWRILRTFLQLLRDELTVDEAAQLAAQLPLVLRGAFYEGFDPSRRPAGPRTREGFLVEFADRARLDGDIDPERAAHAAVDVLSRHVSEGEVDDVLAQLPPALRELLVP
jgi:uncharacterized protein (DUF2267 family)